jgi:tRNA dimethylallyltransferase
MGQRIEKPELPYVIFIIGPTASGKTSVSLKLAVLLDIEIISADSRQIYKYLDIGTAKPELDELAKVQHHFIDIILPDQYYSAGIFGDQAAAKAEEIISRKRNPVVVGGSGLYIRAMAEGLFPEEATDDPRRQKIREQIEARITHDGIEVVYNELMVVDPVSASKYSDMNPRRILRALEYYYMTGNPLSIAHSKPETRRNFIPLYFEIQHERSALYNIINQRSKIMWARGLVNETRRVLDMGFAEELNALNTVGYKEAIKFIHGQLNEDKALELMQQSTRNYAKRQLTWFKSIESSVKVSGSSEAIASKIVSLYKKLSS